MYKIRKAKKEDIKNAVASAIITYQGKLLLLRRDYNPGINEPGKWQLPGGGIEAGEGSDDAIRRELKEEVSIVPETINFLGEPLPRTYVYHAPLTEKESCQIKKGSEGMDLKFFSLSELSSIPVTQKLKEALKTHRKIFESLMI